MYYGIAWDDVRATIPQPLRAQDAVCGDRSATARLWYTPVAQQPYRVELRLLVDGEVTEIWSRVFVHINPAMVNYDDGLPKAAAWMTGAPREMVRPGRGWKIEKQ